MTAEKKYKDRQAVLQNSRTAFFHAFKEVTGGKEGDKTAHGSGEGGAHPHVHLIVYSKLENEGYLTKRGVQNLRSVFAQDIFAQDLVTYMKNRRSTETS